MSDIIDRKYIGLISYRLDRFKQVTRDSWNFRCNICGDSQKSKSKARGYLFAKAGRVFYHCHNCKISLPFGKFLKASDPVMYRDYLVEVFGGPRDVPKGKSSIPSIDAATDMKSHFNSIKKDFNLPAIDDLEENHPARKFLMDRNIPEIFFGDLYYADDFKAAVDEFWPENDKNLLEQEHRIVIPFKDAVGSILGFQGRSLDNTGIRYITIKLNTDSAKIFGLDRLDFTKTIYVVEGPFDSLFIDNALATMDSALYTAPELINETNCDYIFVYDNEPRNREVLKTQKKSINKGQKVVVWPKETNGLKDINDMVNAGLDVQSIIDANVYQGPQAMLEFNNWSRI